MPLDNRRLAMATPSTRSPWVDHVNPTPFEIFHIPGRNIGISRAGNGSYLAVRMVDRQAGGTPGGSNFGIGAGSFPVER